MATSNLPVHDAVDAQELNDLLYDTQPIDFEKLDADPMAISLSTDVQHNVVPPLCIHNLQRWNIAEEQPFEQQLQFFPSIPPAKKKRDRFKYAKRYMKASLPLFLQLECLANFSSMVTEGIPNPRLRQAQRRVLH